MSQPLEQTLDYYYMRLKTIHEMVTKDFPLMREGGFYNHDLEMEVIAALADVGNWREEQTNEPPL